MEGFTYSVSHDLRAPLRAIMASSMMLLEDFGTELPEEAKRHLHRQAAAAKKLAMLIDDLLQYSRLGRKAVDRQSVAISSVAQAIADELSRRHPERLVDWKIQPGLEVQGDPNLATMLLQNLFDNAFKFTSGREHAAIEFGKDDLGFFVRDNGVGFDMQYSGKLFRPFERLHPEVDYEGTGIGLANVKRIVERHGGRVSAEGKVGEGATFRFAF
jgi:light-regulated signal transduction histidine kinase (bacteriophytochrome)